nr:hypothetical protein CFP56_10431 [Quercus suber]
MALSISNSERTLGSDGPWYAFVIQVGSPAQDMFVLPSTTLRQIMLISTFGCDQESDLYGIFDPDCASKRGGLWDPGNSSSLISDGGATGFISFQYSAERALNSSLPSKSQYGGSVSPGQDTVKFGFEGSDTSPLQKQYLASYTATNPYLGSLPLSPYNGTLVSLADTQYSVVGALNASGTLPSRSWAYNAGAPYRNAIGSLTLGGYDSNRGNVENVLTTYMNPRTDRELEVAVVSIELFTNAQPNPPSVGALPITALIDSTVPEIWLPTESCMAFEDVFGITWDDDAEMYLVNDTLHQSLVMQNASVTFTLAPNTSFTSTAVNIRLPYASFNLTAAYPLAGINDSSTTLRYFPLKRASDPSQFFLGRTFFQEA